MHVFQTNTFTIYFPFRKSCAFYLCCWWWKKQNFLSKIDIRIRNDGWTNEIFKMHQMSKTWFKGRFCDIILIVCLRLRNHHIGIIFDQDKKMTHSTWQDFKLPMQKLKKYSVFVLYRKISATDILVLKVNLKYLLLALRVHKNKDSRISLQP